MLQCPKCKFENELGRIFCHQCGNKLDLNQVKPPTEGARIRRRVALSTGRLLRVFVELALAGVLILGVVLVCMVPEVARVQPTNADLIAADTKRLALHQLVNGRRAGKIEVTTVELNAFLHSLSFEKPKGTGIEVVPVILRCDFAEGKLTMGFLGELRLGNHARKQLYLDMTGIPAIEKGRFVFKPLGGHVGALPVPQKLLELTDLFDRYFSGLLGRLGDERDSLNKLSSITVTGERVILDYQPAASR